MKDRSLFTSESVTEGHPDKLADQISDAVLDAVLEQDPGGHVACETVLSTGFAVVTGEIGSNATVDLAKLVRSTIVNVGYNNMICGFDGNTCGIFLAVDEQSADIAQGVAKSYEQRHADSIDPFDAQGAGDQGMMFGYACSETTALMPAPIWTAHRLAERLAHVRKERILPYLMPDGKTQVTYVYERGVPVAVDTIVISTMHSAAQPVDTTMIKDLRHHVVEPVLNTLQAGGDYRFFVNPTGSFVKGGPAADAGLTGRKIIVDTYGGMARHGGGAFSGKDPSKVDRSGAYAARWVAKNVVASGAAATCEIQLAYAIGVASPISVRVDTFGTENVAPGKLQAAIQEIFDLRPAAIIQTLDLRRPIYRRTAAYGHFGRESGLFPWESTDRADDIRRALGL
jgi:S-adenosylmethionine synthetase